MKAIFCFSGLLKLQLSGSASALRFRLLPVIVASLTGLMSTALFAQREDIPRDERPTKHVLPYVEAEAEADGSSVGGGSALRWLTATRLLFTAIKSVPFGGKAIPKYEIVDGLLQMNGAECCEVLVLDVLTGKTTHHLDGVLSGVHDDRDLKFDGTDVISVGQKGLGNPVRADERDRAYGQGVSGPFGEEKPFMTRWNTPVTKVEDKPCSGYTNGKVHVVWLRPEHGCLVVTPSTAQKPMTAVYFRSDGTQIPINLAHNIRSAPYWVAWLGAYLLNDTTARVNGIEKTFPIMNPDGRILAIPVAGRATPNYVRPSRAGMIGTINVGGSSSYSGVFLLRNGKVQQVAEGHVAPKLAVSPDGCHVAYIAELYLFSLPVDHRRIRVIDVCTGLGVAPTDNPFQ